MNQPDLHHEGSLTIELVSELMNKLKVALDDVVAFVPPDADVEWVFCKRNWAEKLLDAGLRCAAILIKLEHKIEHRLKDDHKSVDITLCILRDYEAAKAKGFVRNLPMECPKCNGPKSAKAAICFQCTTIRNKELRLKKYGERKRCPKCNGPKSNQSAICVKCTTPYDGHSAISENNPQWNDILEMYFNGVSYQEIADFAGVSRETVVQKFHRMGEKIDVMMGVYVGRK